MPPEEPPLTEEDFSETAPEDTLEEEEYQDYKAYMIGKAVPPSTPELLEKMREHGWDCSWRQYHALKDMIYWS